MKMGAAPRQAYGEKLLELAHDNKNIVALDGDLSKSTMSCLIEENYPERFFEMSIAEQNMVATAAGMALKGKIPFVNSFAVFLTGRAFDQVRQSVAYPALNVKVCGSSAGLSDFGDGATHQSVEDIALMRSLPNMIVLSPVDEIETKAMVDFMVRHNGPVYLRLDRNDTPIILDASYKFELGKPNLIAEGSDVTIFASGRMVSIAIKAAELLKKTDNVSAQIVNVGTIKPLDQKAVQGFAEKTGAVVTAEEHNVFGGMGSAIAESLMTSKIPIIPVGVDDRFGQSAKSFEDLLVEYGLTEESIAQAARKVLTFK
jgi:transketolase